MPKENEQREEIRELVNQYEDAHKHLRGYYSRTDLLAIAKLASAPTPAPDWNTETDPLLAELRYISASPSQENGGFHPRVVAAAQKAIERIQAGLTAPASPPDGLEQLLEDMAVLLDGYEGTCSCPEGQTCDQCKRVLAVLDRWAVWSETRVLPSNAPASADGWVSTARLKLAEAKLVEFGQEWDGTHYVFNGKDAGPMQVCPGEDQRDNVKALRAAGKKGEIGDGSMRMV